MKASTNSIQRRAKGAEGARGSRACLLKPILEILPAIRETLPVEVVGWTNSKNWLPDMDLNHDKQIQNLLCYRYTIGQAGSGRHASRLNS